MNPTNNTSAAPAAQPKPAKPASPAFDEKSAAACPPTRHEPTGRTFAFIQGDELFSATRVHVATDAAAAAAARTALEAAAAATAPAKPKA